MCPQTSYRHNTGDGNEWSQVEPGCADRHHRSRACGTPATPPQMIWENVMGKMSSSFSLKISILIPCIMRLNWFIIKQVQQLINSIYQIQASLSNANFPVFWDVTAHLQSIVNYIHISALYSEICHAFLYQIQFLIQCLIASHKPIRGTDLFCNTCCSFRPSCIFRPVV